MQLRSNAEITVISNHFVHSIYFDRIMKSRLEQTKDNDIVMHELCLSSKTRNDIQWVQGEIIDNTDSSNSIIAIKENEDEKTLACLRSGQYASSHYLLKCQTWRILVFKKRNNKSEPEMVIVALVLYFKYRGQSS